MSSVFSKLHLLLTGTRLQTEMLSSASRKWTSRSSRTAAFYLRPRFTSGCSQPVRTSELSTTTSSRIIEWTIHIVAVLLINFNTCMYIKLTAYFNIIIFIYLFLIYARYNIRVYLFCVHFRENKIQRNIIIMKKVMSKVIWVVRSKVY